jgi:hypothetical protein
MIFQDVYDFFKQSFTTAYEKVKDLSNNPAYSNPLGWAIAGTITFAILTLITATLLAIPMLYVGAALFSITAATTFYFRNDLKEGYKNYMENTLWDKMKELNSPNDASFKEKFYKCAKTKINQLGEDRESRLFLARWEHKALEKMRHLAGQARDHMKEEIMNELDKKCNSIIGSTMRQKP